MRQTCHMNHIESIYAAFSVPCATYSKQMRCVEQAITGISGATVSKLGLGSSKRNKMKTYLICKCLFKTPSPDTLSLHHAGDYHDSDSSVQLATVLHKSNDNLLVLITQSTSTTVNCPSRW